MKKNNPELATFTLLNPDFHASVDEGAAMEMEAGAEEDSSNAKRPPSEPEE